MNEKDYSKKINKKVRAKALYTVLSEKLRNGEVIFIDTISIKEPKTTEAKGILSALAGVKGFEKILTKRKNAAYFATGEASLAVSKSFANLGNVQFDTVQNMNPVDLLNHKYVVIVSPEKANSFIEGKLASVATIAGAEGVK